MINTVNQPGPITANFACFVAMMMWATGFPAAEVLMESWGALSVLSVRIMIAVVMLVGLWAATEGLSTMRAAAWGPGLLIGGTGFGIGAILLLVGQKMSDPVTPAIAAAMMPIAGLALEVLLDKRRLRLNLLIGVALALTGGLMATGVRLSDGTYGVGALLCLIAVILFAWATRATTRNLSSLSALGQTTITMVGGFSIILIVCAIAMVLGLGETHVGKMDSRHIMLMLVFALPAVAISQLLWIWAAGGLGIMLASLHMNALPFYVMLIMVLFLDGLWGWDQAFGAALVGAGVLVAQRRTRHQVPEA